MGEPIKNRIGHVEREKRPEAERKMLFEIMNQGINSPFWREMVKVIDKEIDTFSDICCHTMMVGDGAAKVARSQGALMALHSLKKVPERLIKELSKG